MFNINKKINSTFLHENTEISKIMLIIALALLPSIIYSAFFNGISVLKIILVSVSAAAFVEFAWQKLLKKPVQIQDFSAGLSGLFLAFMLPNTIPLWIAGIGAIAGIIFGKQIFGGIGRNPINPAITGWLFLKIFWPSQMGGSLLGLLNIFENYSITQEADTSIAYWLKILFSNELQYSSLFDPLFLLLILGGLFLIFSGNISIHIPLSYLVSILVGSYLILLITGKVLAVPVISHIFVFSAFFLAVDFSTSPASKKGKIIFGIGCGIISSLIVYKAGLADGFYLSILIMNLLVPVINRLTIPKPFGGKIRRSFIKLT